jgi:hypothetical protein
MARRTVVYRHKKTERKPKRYSLLVWGEEEGKMVEDELGEWIRREDYNAQLAAKDKRIKELEAADCKLCAQTKESFCNPYRKLEKENAALKAQLATVYTTSSIDAIKALTKERDDLRASHKEATKDYDAQARENVALREERDVAIANSIPLSEVHDAKIYLKQIADLKAQLKCYEDERRENGLKYAAMRKRIEKALGFLNGSGETGWIIDHARKVLENKGRRK